MGTRGRRGSALSITVIVLMVFFTLGSALLSLTTGSLMRSKNDLLRAQAHLAFAVQQGDGGRNGAGFPHDGFHFQGRLHVFRIWHAVRNDGGFQGHYGPAFGQGLLYVGMDVQ